MGMFIGPLHVRRSIFIEANAARVWQEFESPERIKAWLSLGHVLHEIDLVVGGDVSLSVEIDGEDLYFGGQITVIEPQHELSFESQWRTDGEWSVPTFWTIRLTEMYGGTQVELFHHGFERLGAEAADNLQGYEEGWDTKHLNQLRTLIEG